MADQPRLLSALQNNYTQFLDRDVQTPKAAATVIAVLDANGNADYFTNCDLPIDCDALGALLSRHASSLAFSIGSVLVLGRDRSPSSRSELFGAYPRLLDALSAEAAASERLRQSRAGLIGLGYGDLSAVPAVLWWSLAAVVEQPAGADAVNALGRCAAAFDSVTATPWAKRARSLAAEVNDSLQMDLFDPVPPARVSPLRYEVLPVSYLGLASIPTSDFAQSVLAPTLRWRWRARSIEPVSLDDADYSDVPLVLRTSSSTLIGPGHWSVDVGLDYLPRAALGLKPLKTQPLRYSFSSALAEIIPPRAVGSAGESLAFDVFGDPALAGHELDLTVTGKLGQVFRFKVALASALRGSDDGRRTRRAA